MAELPQVVPTDLSHGGGEQARPAEQKTEVHQVAYQPPRKIGQEQAPGLVLDEEPRGAADRLVELPGLEEEKGQEEERPRHQFAEMVLATQVAHPYHMQHHHPDNAQPTQQVKGMVSCFHRRKDTKIITNYQLSIINYLLSLSP
jgi:hypothetical protein